MNATNSASATAGKSSVQTRFEGIGFALSVLQENGWGRSAVGRAFIPSETCCCSLSVSSDHVKHTHHPLVFMLQDVAVVHALPLHVLPDFESYCLRLSDVHRVLPGKIPGLRVGPVRLSLGDLELCAVQMEWVV